MSRFIFLCGQTRFAVPGGESRIGSDSVCQICIQGEGVLPVHAYLKVDGEKMVIRGSSEKSIVLVEGRPINGPQAVKDGGTVSIGALKLLLETDRSARQPLLQRKWVRRTLFAIAPLAALVLLAVLLRMLWFNDAWVKEQLVKQVDRSLVREDTQIESVRLNLFNGQILIRNLRVPNRDGWQERNLLEVDEIQGKVDPWALARSWFSGPLKIRAGELKFTHPQLSVERVQREGRAITNVDDILRRYQEGPPRAYPIDLGLGALETSLTIEQGVVSLRDDFTHVGESRLENIALRLDQRGFGEKLDFDLAAQAMMRPIGEERLRPAGRLELKGSFQLFSRDGLIAPEDMGQGTAKLVPVKFDLARLFSHLQWDFPVGAGRLRVVPGKPLSGEFTVTFQNLKEFFLSGQAESESLVSVLEKDKPPSGDIPTCVDIQLTYHTERGPTQVNLDLRCAKTVEDARANLNSFLTLAARGKRDTEGTYLYTLDLGTKLDDLFATEVGERLGLQGRLRGTLNGAAKLALGREGLQFDINATQKGEFSAPHPSDPRGKREWVPTHVSLGCRATALPNERGEISTVEAIFNAKAWPTRKNKYGSFEATSITPAKIENIDTPEKVRINTQFNLDLRGREFCDEFKPYLDLLGLTKPFEEHVSLKVTLYSGPSGQPGQDTVQVGLNGQARAQWDDALTPVQLLYHMEYFPGLANAPAVAGQKSPPYVKVTFQTGTPQAPPYVRVDNAQIHQQGGRHLLHAPHEIESDMVALRKRFDPYLQRAAEFLGRRALLDDYTFTGNLHQKGVLNLGWDAEEAADGTRTLEAGFDLSVEGNTLRLEGPLPGGGTTGQPSRRFVWEESRPVVALKGKYLSKPSNNREEPDVRQLDLERLDMQGSLGAFTLNARDVDLWMLEQLARHDMRLPGKTHADTVRDVSFQGTLEPRAFEFLRSLELQPAELKVDGRLRLNARYQRETGKLSIKELVFENTGERDFWLRDLSVVGGVRNVKAFFEPGRVPRDGGAALLEHLDESFELRSLTLNAPLFGRWVFLHSDAARKLGVPEAMLTRLREKTLVLEGDWMIRNFALRPTPDQARSWNISGEFRNDLKLLLPRDGQAPLEAVFHGPWSIQEKKISTLNFTDDYSVFSLLLNAHFDTAALTLKRALPEWDYVKPAGQPLTLHAQISRSPGTLDANGKAKPTIYASDVIELSGGPLHVRLNGLDVQSLFTGPDSPETLQRLDLRQARVSGGPLQWSEKDPCTLERFSYDGTSGREKFLLRVPHLDASVMAQMLGSLADAPQASPRLQGMSKFFKTTRFEGAFSDLVLDVHATPTALESFDLQPAQDKLDLRFNNALTLTGMPSPGEVLRLHSKGTWALNSTEVRATALDSSLSHALPTVPGQPPKAHLTLLNADGLWISSRDANLNLNRALFAAAPPLDLKLPLRFKSPLDLDALQAGVDALGRLTYPHPVTGTARTPVTTNPYEPLAAMVINGSLSIPVLRTSGEPFSKVETPKFSMKDLKLTVPQLSAEYCGGVLSIGQFIADLSTATQENKTRMKFEPFNLKLARANLVKLSGSSGESGGYRYDGLVTCEGVLAGQGFAPPDRRTWQGALEVTLDDVVVGRPGAAAPSPTTKPKEKRGVWDIFSPQIMERVAPKINMGNVTDMLKGTPLLSGAGLQRSLNLGFFGADMFLGFLGMETARFDFHPIKVQVTIQNGIADIRLAPGSRFAAKAPSEGLELNFKGRIRLWDMSIEDTFDLEIVSLTEAQKQALGLELWPEQKRKEFMSDLKEGRLTLKLRGTLDQPQDNLAEVRAKLQRHVMQAVFGQDGFGDGADVEQGLSTLRSSRFGQNDANVDLAGRLLNMVGIPLPKTENSKLTGTSIFDRVTGLAPHLKDLGGPLGGTLTPGEVLKKMLSTPVPVDPRNPPPQQPAPAPESDPALKVPLPKLDELRAVGAEER